jgi:hypothetical protein
MFKPLNAELNLICHLLALLGAHRILHVSMIRVKIYIKLKKKNAMLLVGHTARRFFTCETAADV